MEVLGAIVATFIALVVGVLLITMAKNAWWAVTGASKPLRPKSDGKDAPGRGQFVPEESKELSSVPSVDASPRASAAEARSLGITDAVTLADANQFLRYRAESRAKVDAQAALMDGLLTRPDAPPLKAVLLRSTDRNDEFRWLVVKSGTRGSIAEMRSYEGFGATFKGLFGDQPFSIVWADHIAENCPGPGEAVTPLGQERYARIAQDIREGKYVVERHLGAARS